MMAAGYSLDLYCDSDAKHTYEENKKWSPAQYFGETFAGCARQARRDGWLISKKRQLCPKCSGKKGENND